MTESSIDAVNGEAQQAERPLAVMITAPWADRLGGAEGMLCTFLEYLDRGRIDPHVVLLANGPLVGYLRNLDIRVSVIPAGRLHQAHLTVRAIRRLSRMIAAERPDVILSWTTKSHVYAALAAILAKRANRLIWWQHGIPKLDPLDILAVSLPAAAIGCSSEAVAIAQRKLFPRRKTVVVYPGIRPAEEHRSGASVRAELGIPDDCRVICLVGRIHPMKGQDLFLESLRLVRSEGRDIHGLLVGGDAYDLAPDYGERLERLVHELGLADHVTMTGQVPLSGPYIDASDILVCASTSEPFGIALLEAMRAGVAVVSTPVGGPSEIIEDGVSGVLLRDRSPSTLAAALGRLLDEPGTRSALGDAGRERVLQTFTAEAMSTRISSVLSAIASRARPDEP